MKKFCAVIALLCIVLFASDGQAQNIVRKFGYTGTWQYRDRTGNIPLILKFKENAHCNLTDHFWAHGGGTDLFYVMPTEVDPTNKFRRLKGTAHIRFRRPVKIQGKYSGTRETEYEALALESGTKLQLTLLRDSNSWIDPQSHKEMSEDIPHKEVKMVILQRVYDL